MYPSLISCAASFSDNRQRIENLVSYVSSTWMLMSFSEPTAERMQVSGLLWVKIAKLDRF